MSAYARGVDTREAYHETLTFEGDTFSMPGTSDAVLRDDPEIAIWAERRKNTESKWYVKRYGVAADDFGYRTEDPDKANVMAILVEEFGPDALTSPKESRSQTLVREGVPPAVAADGKPATAAWLYIRDWERDEIADVLDVSRSTVREYLSRFRARGTGIPDDVDVPDHGEFMPELPTKFDTTVEKVGYVEYACGHEHVGGEPFDGPLLCPTCGGERVSASATYAPIDRDGGEA